MSVLLTTQQKICLINKLISFGMNEEKARKLVLETYK